MNRFIRWATRAFAAAGLLLAIVTVTPVISWWTLWLAGQWDVPEGDLLIVLGGDDMGPGVLGYTSYLRSYHALLVWKTGGVRRVLIAGHDVSPPMRDFLLQHGVPGEAVTVETASRTTFENARQVKRLLGSNPPKRLVLLTSDYHMRRSAAVFARQGLMVRTSPVPDALKRSATDWMARWQLLFVLGQETMKFYAYRWWGMA